MDTEKYKVLLKVLETGNFTRAAEELGCTQSGISHTIQNLEDLLGFPILNRGKGGVSLTLDGESILPRVREIVQMQDSIDQTSAEITGGISGVLRIGTFSSISVHLLPGLLKSFNALYPGVEVRLQDGDYLDIERMVLDGRADCGFVSLPCQEKLACIPLIQERLLAVLPKGHPLAGLEVVPLDALIQETFIIPGEGLKYQVGHLLAGRTLKRQYASKEDYVTISFVRGGLGVSILPELMLRDFGDAVECRPLDVKAERLVGLAVQDFLRISPAGKCFVKFLKSYFQSNAQGVSPSARSAAR